MSRGWCQISQIEDLGCWARSSTEDAQTGVWEIDQTSFGWCFAGHIRDPKSETIFTFTADLYQHIKPHF